MFMLMLMLYIEWYLLEELRVEAKQFKKNVRKARLHLWWKNKKMTIMIVLAATIAVAIGISK